MSKNSDLNKLGRGGCLGLGLVMVIVMSLLQFGAERASSTGGWVIYFLVSLFFIPMAWLRLKDAGQNPWWAFGMVVPIVSFAVALWCIGAPSGEKGFRESVKWNLSGRGMYVVCAAVLAAFLVVLVAGFRGVFPPEHTRIIGAISLIGFWVSFFAFVPLTWQRYKDAGLDGKWALTWLIPGVGFITLVVGMILPSKSEGEIVIQPEEPEVASSVSTIFPSTNRIWSGRNDGSLESSTLHVKAGSVGAFGAVLKVTGIIAAIFGFVWLGLVPMCSTIPNPKTDPAYAEAVAGVEWLGALVQKKYRVNFQVEKLETSEVMVLAKRWEIARLEGDGEKLILEVAEKYRARMGDLN
jgi:uncharacterized membrane protein YhaH (DUF805 family)